MENNLSELKFKEWLDKSKIPYWYIQQDIETFSEGLKKHLLKRPDFMLLLPNFGFILIDVKNKKPAEKHEKFFIPIDEVEKYLNLQRTFNLQCWFVISNEDCHYNTWYWIPITKIVKTSFRFKGEYSECYSVPLSEFIQVSNNDSLDRVFEGIFKFN